MKKTNLEKVRLVGGYLPQPLAEKLSVLSLFHDDSRSNIIRSLLEKQLQEAPPTAHMLEEIAWRFYKSWCQTIPLSDYLNTVATHLENKKISDGHIIYVIRLIEEIAKEESGGGAHYQDQ